MESGLGVSLREADDLPTLPLSHDDRAGSWRRPPAGATPPPPASLACTVLRTVLHDGLLNAVLDDGR